MPHFKKIKLKGVINRHPYFLILFTGFAVLVCFAMAESILIHHIIKLHKTIDAENTLNNIAHRISGHLELMKFIERSPSYVTSLDWLIDELYEQKSLYGFIVKEENKDVVNTFPHDFDISDQDWNHCFKGIEKKGIFILCKATEPLPDKRLIIMSGLDISEELSIYRLSLMVSLAVFTLCLFIFSVIWIQFNRFLLKQKRLEDQLSASEKLAITGKLAAMIAHEIRNPLNTVSMALQYMSETASFDPEMAKILTEEIKKLKTLSSELFGVGIAFNIKKDIFSVRTLVTGLESRFSEKATQMGISFTCRINSDALIRGDQKWFSRALENLVRNAVEAVIPPEGLVEVSVEERKGTILLSVRDNGPGVQGREGIIFEPFYTTKEGGFGLGLYIVRKVVEAHGGILEVISPDKDGYTTFTIAMPKKS